MPNGSTAELYFVAGTMFFMLLFSGVVIYFFIRTYKKEKAEKTERLRKKEQEKAEKNANHNQS